jgi:hypothetical protein
MSGIKDKLSGRSEMFGPFKYERATDMGNAEKSLALGAARALVS